MKKFLFLVVAFFLTISGYAQLVVKQGSFKKVDGFVNLNLDKQTDDNDRPYAVLKIRTENIDGKQRRELDFKGDARTFFEVEYKDGEVWLYISYYATYIKISHDDMSSAEFWFPFDMEPKCGYELTLVNKTAIVSNGWASLKITTKPEDGAKVLLNGHDFNATTPYINTMIPSGKYEITASKYRFVTTTKTIEINDGENADVEIEMEYAYGKLFVSSEPSGAAIFIDGENYGVTPSELNHIIVGTHELKLKNDGFETLTKTITIDDTTTLTVNEKLLAGRRISITTDGSGDQIFVDGKCIGVSPLAVTLSYGKHEVKAIRDDYEGKKSIKVAKDGGDVIVKLLLSKNKTFTVNGVTFEMVFVKGGTFTMGATAEQTNGVNETERPTHNVTVNDYYIGQFVVTQELWHAVMGTTLQQQKDDSAKTSAGEGDNYPMYYVSWYECQNFLSELNKLTGKGFRLPTEAEWEYAARGGKRSKGYMFSGNDVADYVAWYYNALDPQTHPVGMKDPNELGIYDMSGNVWEWCYDWFGGYDSNDQTNPLGPTHGTEKVVRGGSWCNNKMYCRVSTRYCFRADYKLNYVGLRLVLVQ